MLVSPTDLPRPCTSNDRHYAPRHVQTRLVSIVPSTHWSRVPRKRLQCPERRPLPETWPQDDRHDSRQAGLVTTQGRLTFDLVAIARFDKMRAHEEQNDCRPIETAIDLPLPVRSRWNHAVVPFEDAAIALLDNQLASNVIHEIFVFVRVREEDLYAPVIVHRPMNRTQGIDDKVPAMTSHVELHSQTTSPLATASKATGRSTRAA